MLSTHTMCTLLMETSQRSDDVCTLEEIIAGLFLPTCSVGKKGAGACRLQESGTRIKCGGWRLWLGGRRDGKREDGGEQKKERRVRGKRMKEVEREDKGDGEKGRNSSGEVRKGMRWGKEADSEGEGRKWGKNGGK